MIRGMTTQDIMGAVIDAVYGEPVLSCRGCGRFISIHNKIAADEADVLEVAACVAEAPPDPNVRFCPVCNRTFKLPLRVSGQFAAR